jgi:putative membrane protein
MKALSIALVSFVAVEHVGFLVLEMFLWNTAYGRKRFGLTPEFAAESAVLAANQGLYNGFLAAGLAWGLWLGNTAQGVAVQTFFLACVAIAGLYGGFTAKRSILFIQFVPAALALAVLRIAS